jgi:hypothetical protein
VVQVEKFQTLRPPAGGRIARFPFAYLRVRSFPAMAATSITASTTSASLEAGTMPNMVTPSLLGRPRVNGQRRRGRRNRTIRRIGAASEHNPSYRGRWRLQTTARASAIRTTSSPKPRPPKSAARA